MTIFRCVSLFFLLLSSSIADKKRGNDRKIQILNDSRSRVAIFWVHPTTQEESAMSDPQGIVPGQDFPLNSFVDHKFIAREVGKDGVCKHAPDKKCRSVSFAVSESDHQVARITSDLEIIFIDSKVKARQAAGDIVKACQDEAVKRIQEAGSDQERTQQALQDLVGCVEGGVAETLEKVHEEIAFQEQVRKDIAANLENYTCLDDTLDSTKDISTEVWRHLGKSHKVHIKHNRAASRIHVVENFIDEEECKAMEEAAAKSLHRATVADGKGGSRLSENRKAMQAGITVQWELEKDGDAIARLSRRVYDYANHVLGLGIKEHGQEDLMSIQYQGRGNDDEAPDRYTPHCDGDCTGLPHKEGQRMATMVMYCTVATKGGHTNFRNAGVHVKPEVGNAVFFSYIDPQTMLMDTGFTEHSGCPVFEGDKKIVTQWIRLGVSEKDPWDSFNTLGIKKSELADLGDVPDTEEFVDADDDVFDEDSDLDDGDEGDEDEALREAFADDVDDDELTKSLDEL